MLLFCLLNYLARASARARGQGLKKKSQGPGAMVRWQGQDSRAKLASFLAKSSTWPGGRARARVGARRTQQEARATGDFPVQVGIFLSR